MKSNFNKEFLALIVAVGLGLLAGCTSIPQRETVSVAGYASMRNEGPRSSMEQINMVKLRMDRPPVELLGPGDVLGIYISTVTGSEDVPPPVYNVDGKSEEDPASGYPYPVRSDGTLSLPLLAEPIYVEGMSLIEAENAIRTAYTIKKRLLGSEAKISVTLIKKRTINVCVIREDLSLAIDPTRGSSSTTQITAAKGTGETYFGNVGRGSAVSLSLPIYKNDNLEALSRSGGMPGLNAKNELIILRKTNNDGNSLGEGDYLPKDGEAFARSVSDRYNETGSLDSFGSDMGIIRIPLRVLPCEEPPRLTSDDVTLRDGDVIYIQSREAEVYYTGGMLKGGVHAIPRDYDLDVLSAIAAAGGGVGAGVGGTDTSTGGRSNFLLAPSRILIIRNHNGRQVAISLKKNDALRDPSSRIYVEPNDVILVEYTNFETLFNIVFSTIRVNINPKDFWD